MDAEVAIIVIALQALQLAQSAILGKVVRNSLRPPPPLQAATRRRRDDDTPEE